MNFFFSSYVYRSEAGLWYRKPKEVMDMEEFERLLEAVRPPVERFVQFRINSQMDADDVLQEVFFGCLSEFFPAAGQKRL